MSTISDFNLASNTQTDHEHQVQLGLLQALCNAAREEHGAAAVGEILERLIAYSEAHFASEELLMRLKSYDEYSDHVDDHDHMLEVLKGIATAHAAGHSVLVASKATEVLGFIGNHIATRDRRFAAYVSSGQ